MQSGSATSRLPFTVSNICFGTSSLGNMPDTYGYEVSEQRARETVLSILEQPNAFIDTSRNYGMGRSEERLGAVIRELGGLPKSAVLSTKLDRGFDDDRLDAARARRSVEESLETLSLDTIDILHLHDPEHCADLDDILAPGGAMDELFRMKEEGIAKTVGLAMGKLSLMTDILPRWEFDALISHNRFTLLNREADQMFSDANARGIAILNAAPYAGGVLAKGSAEMPRISYQLASGDELAPVQAIEEICARYDIPPGAVALQFSMRDPRISSTICGVSKPERVRQTVEWSQWPISDAAWEELMALPYGTDDPEANRVYTPG